MVTLKEVDAKLNLDPIREMEIKLLVKLVAYRREQNITQKELAKNIGMSYARLSKIEVGDNIPRLDTLLKIADGLGLEVALVAKDDQKKIAKLQ